MQQQPVAPWPTVAEVAAQIEVSPSTVRRYLRRHLLRGEKDTRGAWRIEPVSVRRLTTDYLAERRARERRL